jgi:HAE1 family hydrophobic/amphiphilic exporter-1/multidrug efflux pump
LNFIDPFIIFYFLWFRCFIFIAFDQLGIFSQIGTVMLIGLVTKNGILIVEFEISCEAEAF